MKQRFFWAAILDDDSVITEFEPTGEENSYSDLPKDKVKFFGLTSASGGYFFNLLDGKLHINDYKSPGVDIKVPLKRSKLPVPLTGKLAPNQKYNFFQYKEAHQDFNLGLQTSGNVIDKHVFGWKQWKRINPLGAVFIEVGVVINPHEVHVKPLLKIIVRTKEDGNPIAGSPYEFKL